MEEIPRRRLWPRKLPLLLQQVQHPQCLEVGQRQRATTAISTTSAGLRSSCSSDLKAHAQFSTFSRLRGVSYARPRLSLMGSYQEDSQKYVNTFKSKHLEKDQKESFWTWLAPKSILMTYIHSKSQVWECSFLQPHGRTKPGNIDCPSQNVHVLHTSHKARRYADVTWVSSCPSALCWLLPR
jgi:hypothetical protein